MFGHDEPCSAEDIGGNLGGPCGCSRCARERVFEEIKDTALRAVDRGVRATTLKLSAEGQAEYDRLLAKYRPAPLAFRTPTRDEEIEIRFFCYPMHSECSPTHYARRDFAPRGMRPDQCPGCREDHDPGDEG